MCDDNVDDPDISNYENTYRPTIRPDEVISIANLTAKPGQKVSGNVPISIHPSKSTTTSNNNNDINDNENTFIPITIINGNRGDGDADADGPTILILSGIHGSEYIPILTSHQLARTINPTHLSGAIILVNIANIPAFLGRTVYVSPADGKNLNRVFPGVDINTPISDSDSDSSASATISERIADFLVQSVYPYADYAMDVHSGDANEELNPSYTGYYRYGGSHQIQQASKDMAVNFGSDLVVEFQEDLRNCNTGNNNTTTTAGTTSPRKNKAIWAGSAAVVRGIPSIDLELAPGKGRSHGKEAEGHIQEACLGILRVMRHLNIIDVEASMQLRSGLLFNGGEHEDEHNQHQGQIQGQGQDQQQYPCINKVRRYVTTPVIGSWTPLVDTGSYVTKGTLIGYVTDLYGRSKIFDAKAPSDGLVLIRFDTPPVVAGDTLVVLAVLDADEVGAGAGAGAGEIIDENEAIRSAASCERLKQRGVQLLMDSRAHGRGDGHGQDPLEIMPPEKKSLVAWQFAAVIGWTVALLFGLGHLRGRQGGKGVGVGMSRQRNHGYVSTTASEENGNRDTGIGAAEADLDDHVII